MKNKLFRFVILLMTSTALAGCQGDVNSSNDEPQLPNEDKEMKKIEQEYYDFLDNPGNLPISFVYDDVYYKGLSPKYFVKKSQEEIPVDGGVKHITTFSFDNLNVTLESAVYPDYNAYDYTVYFENISKTNSKVIRYLNDINTNFECKSAHLKGIYGDYDYQYKPYDYDLSKENVSFVSTRGRSTHTYFPYFNLEAENNGAIIALGWAGTWNANFSFDQIDKVVNVTGGACNDLCTYIKPGEKIRTSLVAVVRYYDADEDTAMNMWRRWFIDCNMPYEDATKQSKVKTHDFYFTSMDSSLDSVVASIPENYKSAKKAMDAAMSYGLDIDYWWLDAGWYADPNGNDPGYDWWGSVGGWKPVPSKWPGMTLKETSDYFDESYGIKSLIWLEPERVSNINAMVSKHSYCKEWVIKKDGLDVVGLNNLGNKDCLDWTFDKVINVLDTYSMDLYREDFNIDPASYWAINDAWEGTNRIGITENLYIQGHYELWDRILEFAAENGRPTFIDSCASGGGRNDLETMRRAVPLMRSDAEGASISLRLAMTTTFTKWIPYTGCFDKDATSQGTRGTIDEYALRATMFPSLLYSFRVSNKVVDSQIESVLQFQKERKEYKKYFYSDFYVLTDYNSVKDDTNWTAYMYFDSNSDSGVISAFRQIRCEKDSCMVSVKGVNPNHYYRIRDIDNLNNFEKVKGSALIDGLPIYAPNARKGLILYIEPIL